MNRVMAFGYGELTLLVLYTISQLPQVITDDGLRSKGKYG